MPTLLITKRPQIEVPADARLEALPREMREMITEAERRCREDGAPVLRFETFRTRARQQFLYGNGRDAAALRLVKVPEMYAWPRGRIVTKAPDNTRTWHGAGLAVDFIHPQLRWGAPEVWWAHISAIIRPIGFTWGGTWPNLPDVPHFQHRALPISPRLTDKADIGAGNLDAIWRRYLIAA